MLLLGICVVVLGASVGTWTSIACSPPSVHNTEHTSWHTCKSVANDVEASHIVEHNAAHGPGVAPVVGGAALEVVTVGLLVVVRGVGIGAAVVV